jgi:hypothetical protein
VKTVVLLVLNPLLVGLFAFLFTRRRLTFHPDRRLWLTWLSVALTLVNLAWGRTKLIFTAAPKK